MTSCFRAASTHAEWWIYRCHYTGRLTNGSVFDSSYGRRPLTFKVHGRMTAHCFSSGYNAQAVRLHCSTEVLADVAQGRHLWQSCQKRSAPCGQSLHCKLPTRRASAPQIGVRQVIAGWDQGIIGDENIPAMKVSRQPRSRYRRLKCRSLSPEAISACMCLCWLQDGPS